MPNLEHDRAIELYWEKVKEQYPHINFEHFKRICTMPARIIRSLREPTLPVIMIKYLGKFKPTYKLLINARRNWQQKAIEDPDNPKDYDLKAKYINLYLKEMYESDPKFKESMERQGYLK